jgi:hypothetical protein
VAWQKHLKFAETWRTGRHPRVDVEPKDVMQDCGIAFLAGKARTFGRRGIQCGQFLAKAGVQLVLLFETRSEAIMVHGQRPKATTDQALDARLSPKEGTSAPRRKRPQDMTKTGGKATGSFLWRRRRRISQSSNKISIHARPRLNRDITKENIVLNVRVHQGCCSH